MTCGAVKGQDESPFRAPLTAPQVTPELDAARKKTSKVSREDAKRGVLWGRPSCQSSLLRDPNAKFSVEMWRKPRRHCPLPVLGPGTPAAKVLGESGYARQLSGRNKFPLELRSGVDIGWPFFAPRCFVSVPLPHIPLEDSPADLILVAGHKSGHSRLKQPRQEML